MKCFRIYYFIARYAGHVQHTRRFEVDSRELGLSQDMDEHVEELRAWQMAALKAFALGRNNEEIESIKLIICKVDTE